MSNRKTIVTPLLLAGSIALGFGLVWLAAWGLIVSWVGTLLAERPTYLNENLQIRSDGTPLIQFYSPSAANLFGSHRYRTVQGDEVDFGKGTELMSASDLWSNGAALSGPAVSPTSPWGLPWSRRITSYRDQLDPPIDWYLIHDGHEDGSAYFVGYNTATNAQIGFVGTTGFRSDAIGRAERFRMAARAMTDASKSALSTMYWSPVMSGQFPSGVVYLVAQQRLYEVNLRQRSVRVLFDDSQSPVVSVAIIPMSAGQGRIDVARLVIRSTKRLIVLGPDGEETRSILIPRELEQQHFAWHELDGGRALAHVYGGMDPAGQRHELLYSIQPDGEIERKEQIDLQVFKMPNGGGVDFETEAASAIAFWLCPSPAPLDLFVALLSWFVDEPADPHMRGNAPTAADFWPALAGSHILAAILAWITLRRCVRFALTRRQFVAWTVFVLLLGLPGWIGFLVHRRWPVLESCPSCSRRVPIDREACSSCDAMFPEPARRGIEVFA